MTVDLFQILIVSVGGGGLVTAITIGYNAGRKQATTDARLAAIETHFGEHGRVGLLWKFFEDGTLHALRARGIIKENSPISLADVREHVAARGGIPRHIYEKFLDMVPRAPQANEDIVRFVIAELGWNELIKSRADHLGWTRGEYIYQWKIAIEEAQRDGLEKVAAKLAGMVAE